MMLQIRDLKCRVTLRFLTHPRSPYRRHVSAAAAAAAAATAAVCQKVA